MKPQPFSEILDQLYLAADEQGSVVTSLADLCTASGYSQATVRRALDAIQAAGEALIERKRGRGGGYRIVLTGLSTIPENPEHNLSTIPEHAMPLENSAQAELRSATEPEQNSLGSDDEHNSEHNSVPDWVRGSWVPAELPADVRMRGAQFFKEVREGLLPNKPKGQKAKVVKDLEPLPKQTPKAP